MDIETVEIVNADAKSGFTRINKSDYDPARHVLLADAQAAEAAAKAAAEAKAAEEAAKAAKGAKG